jgi:methylated-DNA-protein-cysteine methyltransferase-like protein
MDKTYFYKINPCHNYFNIYIFWHKKSRFMDKEKKTPTYIEEVYEVTRQIPFGKVTTYGRIANCLSLGSARMVGWALNKCGSVEPFVPAHRVVNRKGELSGRNFFKTPTLMQELLENEGIKIENDTIIDLKSVLWEEI